MSLPRAATSFAASSSVSTPATCAAAISPTECPARWSGRTPHDSRSRCRATWKANSAGCAQPVRFSSSASSPHITSRSGRSSSRSRCAHTESRASANTPNRS